MPYIQLRPDSYSDRPVASRVALFGPPATFKTTAIVKTWPRQHGDRDKLAILSYPGEKGWETIPRDDPDLLPFVWEIEDPEKISPHQIVKEVESTTARILAGEFGKVATFAGDGAHKLYQWYLMRAHQDRIANPPRDWDGDEDKLLGPAYGQAHKDYGLYMTRLLSAKVPYVVVTFWQSMEKDDPDDLRRRAPKHIFPDLPGQMAKNIVGEFSAVMFCEATPPDMRGRSRGFWLTRPEGRVWGACIKVPPEIGQNIPVRIPQHFDVLQKYMAGEHEAADKLAREIQPPAPTGLPPRIPPDTPPTPVQSVLSQAIPVPARPTLNLKRPTK